MRPDLSTLLFILALSYLAMRGRGSFRFLDRWKSGWVLALTIGLGAISLILAGFILAPARPRCRAHELIRVERGEAIVAPADLPPVAPPKVLP